MQFLAATQVTFLIRGCQLSGVGFGFGFGFVRTVGCLSTALMVEYHKSVGR
jgi:hypothetical protein